jgi:hypothetical protein
LSLQGHRNSQALILEPSLRRLFRRELLPLQESLFQLVQARFQESYLLKYLLRSCLFH